MSRPMIEELNLRLQEVSLPMEEYIRVESRKELKNMDWVAPNAGNKSGPKAKPLREGEKEAGSRSSELMAIIRTYMESCCLVSMTIGGFIVGFGIIVGILLLGMLLTGIVVAYSS